MVNKMALIEQLENDNWQDRLRMFFETTLDILKDDPYQHSGSSIDDLRAWIRQGGMSCVKEHLIRQMKIRQFSDDKKRAIISALRDGSVVFWKHVNLHGEFDFSDDVEANSLELLLPEILSVNMAKFLEVKNDVTLHH